MENSINYNDPKPGKSAKSSYESYRSISLLSILSKLFKKLLLLRINIIMEHYGLIPDHQFGFRSKYVTTEQIYKIVKRLNNDIEVGRYCSAIFLWQTFDKVWHRGLLYKIKNRFAIHFYVIIRSYLLHGVKY